MSKITINKIIKVILFFLILNLAAFTRFYGNNWDQGQHLHPDERFLTIVATTISWPKNFMEYLDQKISPLNPHNKGFDFYVYGTWPVIFVRLIAELLGRVSYTDLTLIGRFISGLIDMATVVLVFLIGKRLVMVTNQKLKTQTVFLSGFLAMIVYSLMTLPIQLAHFFTVDPYLNLFLVLSFYLLLFRPTLFRLMLLGVTVALAISAKISGIIILPFVVMHTIYFTIHKLYPIKYMFFQNKFNSKLFYIITHMISIYTVLIVITYLSFRLLMPYLFRESSFFSLTLNPKIQANILTLQGFNSKTAWFPPAVQWVQNIPIVSPLLNIIFIGFGIPLWLLFMLSIFLIFRKIRTHILLFFPLGFIFTILFYQGIQYATPMRYFWPIYPVAAALIGWAATTVYIRSSPAKITIIVIFILATIMPLSFLSIYNKPHSRVQASEWIYNNIPEGKSVSYEHWDDPLPLNLKDKPLTRYQGVELPMYAIDSPEKWQEINDKIKTIDYIILSSNRVYGSINEDVSRYKQTIKWYQDLFSEKLGFTKVAEFSSRPTLPFGNICISLPWFSYGAIDQANQKLESSCRGIQIIDDYVEESWTVYDHPKIIIFKKI